MKKFFKLFGIIAIVAVFTLSAATCFSQSGGGKIVNNAEELKAYIDSQPANSPDKPIKVSMTINDPMLKSVADVIKSAGKYVSLNITGNALTTIPYRAFYECKTLVSITLPNGITNIMHWAFGGCISLSNVKIPNSVTRIWEGAFMGCEKLTNITIPNSVTSIDRRAFEECKNLTSVTIPNSVTSIGEGAFESCTSLAAINVNSGNTKYGSDQGVLYNKDKTILLTFPEGKAGKYTIPNSVTSIEGRAFYNCTGLAEINVDAANTIYSSQDGVLYNKNKTTLIRYPIKKTGTTFTIPDSVTSIDRRAFEECKNLISVTIPDSVTSIENMTFQECTSLTSITIPASVTSIGMYAFKDCTSLTSIIIPINVTSIRLQAFNSCTSLASVTFQSTITSNNFDKLAFSYFKEDDWHQSGDLREKYLAGGPGTYTTTTPVPQEWWKWNPVWTKQ